MLGWSPLCVCSQSKDKLWLAASQTLIKTTERSEFWFSNERQKDEWILNLIRQVWIGSLCAESPALRHFKVNIAFKKFVFCSFCAGITKNLVYIKIAKRVIQEIVMLVWYSQCYHDGFPPIPVSQHYRILLATHCQLWTHQHLYIRTLSVTLIGK